MLLQREREIKKERKKERGRERKREREKERKRPYGGQKISKAPLVHLFGVIVVVCVVGLVVGLVVVRVVVRVVVSSNGRAKGKTPSQRSRPFQMPRFSFRFLFAKRKSAPAIPRA
jgi:hypothetical protein